MPTAGVYLAHLYTGLESKFNVLAAWKTFLTTLKAPGVCGDRDRSF
jgi:hypothetical protein